MLYTTWHGDRYEKTNKMTVAKKKKKITVIETKLPNTVFI